MFDPDSRSAYAARSMSMTRRTVVTGSFALLVAPLFARAQGTQRVPRVGIVGPTSAVMAWHQMDALREGLRALGYIEGQNIAIEERWADGKLERLGDLIADLQRSKVDVIVVGAATGARAAKQAATMTPVVFVAVTDPIGSGIVKSLARPGGNLTGTSLVIGEDLAGKWVELAKETLPRAASIAALGDTGHPMTGRYMSAIEAAARTLGLRLQILEMRSGADLESVLSSITRMPSDVLIVTASPLFGFHRKTIADFALRRRLPTLSYDRQFVVDGILMSYGPSIAEAYRVTAIYIDRILKGAKPADLPVEQPTKFELFINRKTAKALGLTIPPSLLLRADHVIE